MTPEEINKKAKEAFPDGVDNERDTAMLRLGFETAYKEISALPTIKGWVARDKNGQMWLYGQMPWRNVSVWTTNNGRNFIRIDPTLFPDLRWEDEPIEVELPIIRK